MEEACDFPGFLGIGPPHSDYPTARAAILPIPLEATTCYLKGTARGPQAILDASHLLELHDEELGRETYRAGIATLPEVEVAGVSYEEAAQCIEAAAHRVLRDGKLLVALGGEHSVTPPLVRAAARVFGTLTVLALDAHADLRDAYQGAPHSHACALRRIREHWPAVQIGVRSLSAPEARLIREGNHCVFFAHEMASAPSWADRALDRLEGTVYLTIDLDCFDPSVVPAVGTPEPGGLGWYEALRFLRRVAARCRIVALDIVELCPIAGQVASDFAAAKLAYRLIGYILSDNEPSP